MAAAFGLQAACGADWHPAAAPIVTRWAKDVAPDAAHREYPRPQLIRPDWLSLNGLWKYAVRPKDAPQPNQFDGSILVPFPIESSVSGVMKRVGPEQQVWYRRSLAVPQAWVGKRVLLHFEAVDWEAAVWIDGRKLGTHRGGYTPFTFEITDAAPPGSTHELTVAAWDPSDAGTQPRGKQVNNPRGIYYTPSTGIWQSVWLEPVARSYFRDVRLEPDVLEHKVIVRADVDGPGEDSVVEAELRAAAAGLNGELGERTLARVSGSPGKPLTIVVPVADVRLWTPDSPRLYTVSLKLRNSPHRPPVPSAQSLDDVTTYFALRSIGIAQGPDKKTRIVLNGKPIFLIGPLDQGFWPDGLYTAPTDEALRSDIETTKKLGFNLIRKHVKVEPARWYYWCYRLGMLVFQDMPSGDRSAPERSRTKLEIQRSAESARQFEAELEEMIHSRRAFPSIVAWVAFNEGWGQFDTVRICRRIHSLDPGRLVDPASGWHDFPVGDIHDIHRYPGPAAPPADSLRAAVLGEFGGLGLPIPEHLWISGRKNWGYRKYKTRDELTEAYLKLTAKLAPLVESHLSAAVYTQTTDVETEVNGLMTYDRAVIKMDAAKVRAANVKLIGLIPAH